MLLWGKIANEEGAFKNINVSDSVKIQAIHRSDGKSDVFFVANIARIPGEATCSFGVSGKVPEIWDPVTVQMRDLPDYTIKDGQTIIPLKFDVAQSFFIVFRKDINSSEVPKTDKRAENFPTLHAVYDISGEWKVQFDPKWGGPKEPVVFSSLEDWTKRTEKGVKYYSGTAKYMKVFDCEKNIINKNLYIGLGVVKHIARVKLNGKNLGVVWCAPWKIAIPMGLLKTKGNKIEIEITNVWANRLIGDEQEPDDCVWEQAPAPFEKGAYLKEFPDWFLKNKQRPSKGRYCFTTWNYFTKNSPLISSGLIGPVTIESI